MTHPNETVFVGGAWNALRQAGLRREADAVIDAKPRRLRTAVDHAIRECGKVLCRCGRARQRGVLAALYDLARVIRAIEYVNGKEPTP